MRLDMGRAMIGIGGFVTAVLVATAVAGGTNSSTGIGVAVCGALLVAAALYAFHKRVLAPLQTLSSYMTQLSTNAVDGPAPFAGRTDEFGRMNDALEVFRDALTKCRNAEAQAAEAQRLIEEQTKDREAGAKWYIENRTFFMENYTRAMEQLASGNLEFRLDKPFIEDYEKLRADFNTAATRLQETMQGLLNSSQSIRSSTEEITGAADELSRRTENQAASLEESTAALNHITETVQKSADGASHARKVVATAKNDAEKSSDVVRQTVKAMSDIEQSSQQISQIIGVIDEIAFQTNLLALNAGVEAARAGDAGRGFAVVASEVRALAQRSAEAAKEIKGLISVSTVQVDQGVRLVAETGQSLERILGQVTEINAIVSDIAAGAREQATALQEVSSAINEMDRMTQQNAAMVEETTAATHSLARDTEQLADLISQFEVGQIDEPVRSPARSPRAPARRSNVQMLNQAKAAMRAPAKSNLARKLEPLADAVEEGWEEF
jgi:methyl-accepting chemotaxis protein